MGSPFARAAMTEDAQVEKPSASPNNYMFVMSSFQVGKYAGLRNILDFSILDYQIMIDLPQGSILQVHRSCPLHLLVSTKFCLAFLCLRPHSQKFLHGMLQFCRLSHVHVAIWTILVSSVPGWQLQSPFDTEVLAWRQFSHGMSSEVVSS